MAVDPILGWTLISESEDDPFTRSNEADERITKATQQHIDIDCTAGGTIVVSSTNFLENCHMTLSGSPGAGFTLEVPDGDKKYAIDNTSGQGATVDTLTGAASPITLPNGSVFHFQNNGIEIIKTADIGGTAGQLFADGSVLPTGNFDWNDKNINNLLLKDYHEVDSVPGISSGAVTFDVSLGNTFLVLLTENVTAITTTGLHATGTTSFTVKWKQDPATPRTVAWPSSYKWPAGTPPTITATTNAVDITVHMTDDNGTNVYSMVGGQAFA